MSLNIYPQQPGEPVGEYAYRVLRKNILAVNLEPGECISPVEVSDALHISRTPIQGAFARLMADGLLNIYPQRGSYVSKIDMKRVTESVIMRNLADQTVMRSLCSDGISREGLMELESNLHQQNFSFERELHEDVFELDNRFHNLMYHLCGLEHVYQAIQSISADQYRVRLLKLNAHIRWDETVDEHVEIIRAIRDKDVEQGLRLSFEHISRIAWDLESVHQKHPAYFENWDTHPPLSLDYKIDSYYNMISNSKQ